MSEEKADLLILAVTLGAMIVAAVWFAVERALKARAEMRAKNPCKYEGHGKRWLAIRRTGPAVPGDTPGTVPFICAGVHQHKIGDQPYYARWACRNCPKMGEDCLGCDQDWKIEHEELVPDVKKWANWSKEPPL